VLENKTRNPPKQDWVGVFLRCIPKAIKKENLEAELSKACELTFIEELVEYENYKYGLVGV
jgi:hypothetical protein